MPKATSKKPNRSSRTSPLQVQPRRSTRQVAMQSLSDVDIEGTVSEGEINVGVPDLVDAAASTHAEAPARGPGPRSTKKKPSSARTRGTAHTRSLPNHDFNLDSNPITDFSLGNDMSGMGADNLPTIVRPTPVRQHRQNNARNLLVDDDQIPSTSSGINSTHFDTHVVNMQEVSSPQDAPTRQEFLDLKEQIMTLTATLASVVSDTNLNQNVNQNVNQSASVVATGSNNQRSIHLPDPTPEYPIQTVPQDEMIRNIVDSHVQSLIGQTPDSGEVGNFDDARKPIDIKVTESMRQDIWANRYVDFNKLIDIKSPTPGPQTYQFVEGGGRW